MTGNGSYVNLMSSSKLVFLAGFSNKEPLYSAVWVVYLHQFYEIFFLPIDFYKNFTLDRYGA